MTVFVQDDAQKNDQYKSDSSDSGINALALPPMHQSYPSHKQQEGDVHVDVDSCIFT